MKLVVNTTTMYKGAANISINSFDHSNIVYCNVLINVKNFLVIVYNTKNIGYNREIYQFNYKFEYK